MVIFIPSLILIPGAIESGFVGVPVRWHRDFPLVDLLQDLPLFPTFFRRFTDVFPTFFRRFSDVFPTILLTTARQNLRFFRRFSDDPMSRTNIEGTESDRRTTCRALENLPPFPMISRRFPDVPRRSTENVGRIPSVVPPPSSVSLYAKVIRRAVH